MRKLRGANLSNAAFYLRVLEHEFSRYMTDKKVSVITRKNYISDIHNFWHWLFGLLHRTNGRTPADHNELFAAISKNTVIGYKEQLIASNVPATTINRRLSSLRKLFAFCIHMQLTTQNPTEGVTNIEVPRQPASSDLVTLVSEFEQYLIASGAADRTVKYYVADVQQYLAWRSLKPYHSHGTHRT